MLRFDLAAFYNLLETFDHTGRLMFPKDWTGEEVWSRDSENSDSIKAERQRLLSEIASLQRDIAPLNDLMSLNLSDDELQDTSDQIGRLNACLKDAKSKLSQLPQITETWVQDHAAFARRIKVEKELAKAFAAGDLSIVAAHTGSCRGRTGANGPVSACITGYRWSGYPMALVRSAEVRPLSTAPRLTSGLSGSPLMPKHLPI